MRRLLALWAALLTLAVCASPAAAEGPNHPLLSRIDPEFVRHGLPLRPLGQFKDPCGVAVDNEGDVYVADYYQDEVDIFNAKGEFLTKILKEDPIGSSGNPADGPCDLAVDSAGGLYVNNWHKNVVKFLPAQYPPEEETTYTRGPVIDSAHPTSVAVDRNVLADPSDDRVYVDDRTFVAEYEPSGAPVLSGGEPVQIGLGSLIDGYGIAVVDLSGTKRIYVADAAGETVKVYEPASNPLTPVEEINGAGTPQGAFDLTDADLAVDPLDGHLYVTDRLRPGFEHPELVVDELSEAGHYRGRVPFATTEGNETNLVNGRPSGIAVAGGDIYLTSGNYEHRETFDPVGEVLVFGPAPSVTTQILTVEKSGAGSGTVARFPSGWLRCGGACKGEFTHGASLELVATPDPHNRFAGWSGDCESEPSPSTCFLRMEADANVGAEFEPIPQQSLTVAKIGAGSGSVVSSAAGIDCGETCESGFDEGSTVTLTATPAEGSSFDGWQGCGAEPSAGQCQVTMSAAHSVTADFEPIPQPPPPPPPSPAQRTLTVSLTGVGIATGSVISEPAGIDCGSGCARTYLEGTAVTLVARPGSGSDLLGWGGCDDTSGDRCTVALRGDRMVVAAFGPGSAGKLRLRSFNTQGVTATLKVEVPSAGALSASGKYLRSAAALPLAKGPVTLRLRLSSAGVNALRRAKDGQLDVKVALGFAPFDGSTSLHVTRRIIFVREGKAR